MKHETLIQHLHALAPSKSLEYLDDWLRGLNRFEIYSLEKAMPSKCIERQIGLGRGLAILRSEGKIV